MAKKKKKVINETGFESVENALSKTEQYIEENQKSLTIIVSVILPGTCRKGSTGRNVYGREIL